MQCSASSNQLSERICILPLSRITIWNSRFSCPAKGERPAKNETYVVRSWPVALTGCAKIIFKASSIVSTIFSRPMTQTCTGGMALTSRPLPSFVSINSDPVSAMATFAPVIPMSAFKKSGRKVRRINAIISFKLLLTFSPVASLKSCATCSIVL